MGLFRKKTRYGRPEETSRPQLMDEKAPSPVAFIYRSELDYISRCVLDYPGIETGGQLFGFWTSQGAPVVLYAIGPGPNANHQPAFFNQDIPYLESIGNELVERYALQHIGEWHSHHQLGLARPSGHDAQTMFNGLINIPQRRLLLCICNYRSGAATVNPYTFHEEHLNYYEDARWIVKEMDSPFRKLADTALAGKLIHPRTKVAVHGEHRLYGNSAPRNANPTQIESTYWVMRPGNAQIMKDMVAYVKSRWAGVDVSVQAGEGVMQMKVAEGNILFRFPKLFPYEAPLLIIDGEPVPGIPWNPVYNDSFIFEAFCAWLSLIEPLCCQKLAPSSPEQPVEEPQQEEPMTETQPTGPASVTDETHQTEEEQPAAPETSVQEDEQNEDNNVNNN